MAIPKCKSPLLTQCAKSDSAQSATISSPRTFSRFEIEIPAIVLFSPLVRSPLRTKTRYLKAFALRA